MASAKPVWTTVSLHPLLGGLDTRSRPADLLPGAFRWRLNFDQSDDGKPCCSSGWTKAWGSSANFVNQDFHARGRTREPINLLFRSVDSYGVRRLFAGTRSSISVLDDLNTGLWSDVLSGFGGADGGQWYAAELKDTILFTNNVDEPRLVTILQPTGTVQSPPPSGTIIADLASLGVARAKFVWSWAGFYFLANTYEGAEQHSTRIRWCDINNPTVWQQGLSSTNLSGVQDLPYGDEIMGGGPMVSGFYIYTRNSIYVMQVSTSSASEFTFNRVYTEPEQQAGCLAYPRSLVTSGTAHWYMSRDGIYRWDPFQSEPVREDWMHRAAGVIYKTVTTQFGGGPQMAPIGWYEPASKTVYFSWPGPNQDNNNWALGLRLDQKTGNIVDHGFTAATTLRFNPETGEVDTETSNILLASGVDWCIKEKDGSVFYREMARLVGGDPSVDLPIDVGYTHDGYYRMLRGTFPTGFNDRQKQIRNLRLEHDTSIQTEPCLIRLRVGNSYSNVDPNDTDDVCAPQWTEYMDKLLSCPEPKAISAMTAANQRASAPGTEWWFLAEGTWLYFELLVANADGSPAVGGDSCLQQIDFSVRVSGPG